jgi:hypothetical protein
MQYQTMKDQCSDVPEGVRSVMACLERGPETSKLARISSTFSSKTGLFGLWLSVHAQGCAGEETKRDRGTNAEIKAYHRWISTIG